jgi:DNA invertase Pin-like site-specific DNA recombinase
LNPDVKLTVEQLLAMGVLTEEGCTRFAELVRSLRSLPFNGGREAKSGPSTAAKSKTKTKTKTKTGRKARVSFTVNKADLEKLYQRHSASEIADAHGVSVSTVNNRLQKWGIKKARKKT